MSKSTGIAYVHHTRNFWSGCTKIGPGCDGCYAEAFNRWTRGKNQETGEAKNWGAGAPRIQHLAGAARDLRKWDREAKAAGERRRVFINTNSDTFDNEVPQGWRDFMWPILRELDQLDFLLVTKRIGNVMDMVPEGWLRDCFPFNVRLLVTVCNQKEANHAVPKLLALPCKNGVSYEPALEMVDWRRLHVWDRVTLDGLTGMHSGHSGPGTIEQCLKDLPSLPGPYQRGIQWLIVGGESPQAGHETRAFNLEWARSTVRQCGEAGTACFVKQLGGFVIGDANDPRNPGLDGDTKMIGDGRGGALARFKFKDRAGADPTEWPEDLRVREYPA